MLKSYEVYSESFAKKVAGIAGRGLLGGTKLIGKGILGGAKIAGRAGLLAAKTVAPELAAYTGDVKNNIKDVLFGKSGSSPKKDKSKVPTINSLIAALPMEFIMNPNLNRKYQLDNKPAINILGLVDPKDESKGFKVNFKGLARLTHGNINTNENDHYIIVTMNGKKIKTDGKLYSIRRVNQLIENQQLMYNQKNILIESKKLVDLFCK